MEILPERGTRRILPCFTSCKASIAEYVETKALFRREVELAQVERVCAPIIRMCRTNV